MPRAVPASTTQSVPIPVSPAIPEQRRRGKGCLMGLGCVLIVLLLGSLAGNAMLGAIVAGDVFGTSTYTDEKTFEEKIVSTDLGADVNAEEKLLRLPIEGTIVHRSSQQNGLSSLAGEQTSSEDVQRKLQQAAEDDSVKGVLLEVNSPGGSVSASDEIARAVDTYRKTGKPIVAYLGELAASGGYYVSLPTDRIIASPSTLTGSIGVIFESINVSGLLERYGVTQTVIKTGAHKDILSPARSMSEDEQKIMQDIADEYFLSFKDLVKANRTIPEDQENEIFDGRVFSAKQAEALGLIDMIGYEEDALQLLGERARITDTPTVIEYDEPFSFENLFSVVYRGGFGSNNAVIQRALSLVSARPEAMYLWRP